MNKTILVSLWCVQKIDTRRADPGIDIDPSAVDTILGLADRLPTRGGDRNAAALAEPLQIQLKTSIAPPKAQ